MLTRKLSKARRPLSEAGRRSARRGISSSPLGDRGEDVELDRGLEDGRSLVGVERLQDPLGARRPVRPRHTPRAHAPTIWRLAVRRARGPGCAPCGRRSQRANAFGPANEIGELGRQRPSDGDPGRKAAKDAEVRHARLPEEPRPPSEHRVHHREGLDRIGLELGLALLEDVPRTACPVRHLLVHPGCTEIDQNRAFKAHPTARNERADFIPSVTGPVRGKGLAP